MSTLSLDEYQQKALSTAIYPADEGLFYPALGLAGEAGEVCNKAKKILRGDATLQDYHKRLEDIADELGDVLWYVAVCARDCGYTLEEVAIRNVNKLAKRAENGTLKGSGDNR